MPRASSPPPTSSICAWRDRRRFESEIFKAWCGWQTAIYDGGSSSAGTPSCLPNWGFSSCGTKPADCSQTNPDTKEVVLRDCGKLYLCAIRQTCTCTATKCSIDLKGNVGFDIALSGEEAGGSITGAFGDRTVHFTRAK